MRLSFRRLAALTAALLIAGVAAACGADQSVGTDTAAPATPAPVPTTSPAGVQSPSPSPLPLPTGSLVPGTTYQITDRCCVGPAGVFLSAPAGWWTFDPIFIGKNVLGDPELYDILLGASLAGNVYTGGCQWHGTALDPPVGPTVDDLATALVAHGGPGTAAPADVTIGGRPGKKVELSMPADVDFATCDRQDGYPVFGRWSPPDAPSVAAPVTYGNGQHNTVYIVDVDGTRQVIYTMYLPGTSAENLAELEQIVESIRFEP